MPAGLCRHVAFRVYIYLKNRGRIADPDLSMAYAVQQQPGKRDLWRAFLVTEASFDQIAAFLNERVEVIELFSQLFWNVRPWLKDKPAVPSLLRLLDDEDQGTRCSATNALKLIDPEAAARAGVR